MLEARGAPPELPEWAYFYFSAFQAIRDDRQYGEGGGGRIFFTSIERWASVYRIPIEDFDMFHRFIRAMDEEYLNWLAKEAKKAADSAREPQE